MLMGGGRRGIPSSQLYYSDLGRTIAWTDGKTLTVQFEASAASSSLVGDVQICGPLYANSSGLKLNDGTNTASLPATWSSADTVTVNVRVRDGKIQLGKK